MKWTPGTQNDDVVDVRGEGGGGGGGNGLKLGAGGIGAVIAVVLISRLFGVDLTGLLGSGNSSPSPSSDTPAPRTGPDPDAPLVDYIKDVMKDIQDTFSTKVEATGTHYRRAKLFIFTDQRETACGHSTAAIGPFYCPGDEHAYIDLSFYRELKERFGAPGNFAQAYVLAHELGHHLQKIFDADAIARRTRGSKNEISVRIELQADCYAGVWGNAAQQKGKLDQGDLEGALTAAAAIGDDRLQKQAGRSVNPESFTHGTSAQRMKWFRRGFDTGRLDACDTFSEVP